MESHMRGEGGSEATQEGGGGREGGATQGLPTVVGAVSRLMGLLCTDAGLSQEAVLGHALPRGSVIEACFGVDQKVPGGRLEGHNKYWPLFPKGKSTIYDVCWGPSVGKLEMH